MLEDALEQYRQGNVRAKVVQEVETELFELYKDPQLKDKPKQLELRGVPTIVMLPVKSFVLSIMIVEKN